jgi:hypothetical protein
MIRIKTINAYDFYKLFRNNIRTSFLFTQTRLKNSKYNRYV